MSIKDEFAEIIKLLAEEEEKCLPELPDYWEKSPAIKAEIELFSRNLQDTVDFLNNECTEEQLLWLSEPAGIPNRFARQLRSRPAPPRTPRRRRQRPT